MTVSNERIADQLEEIADLLDVQGESAFRIRAYRNAARELRDLPRQVADLVSEGVKLTTLRGIGDGIAKKIVELVDTGRLQYLENLEGESGPGLAALLKVPGLGPKRVQRIRDELGATTADAVRTAAREGKLAELSGFSEKLQAKILEALEQETVKKPRVARAAAAPIAGALIEHMHALPGVQRAEVAGSFRRRRESVGDLDVLVVAEGGASAPEHFIKFAGVQSVLALGPTRAAVLLESGLQVDLRVVPAESYGTALHYFTGSKAHNVALRRMAQNQGLKVNEYGIFGERGRVAGDDEEGLYRALGLPYIEPELRENRGEIEAALAGELPRLVEASDLRGDLHWHTRGSDGRDTFETMFATARARGLEYVAITDHAGDLTAPYKLTPDALRRHVDDVRAAAKEVEGLRVLAGAEVDILRDGSLGMPDEVLDELDLVICSLHTHLDLDADEQTARVLAAFEHPRCQIFAHPTGRMIGRVEPARFDLDTILAAAARHGVALEVNGQPKRLDLDDVACRAAKNAGVRLVLNSDAHAAAQIVPHLENALGQARRGWLSASDVLNTLPWPELIAALRGSSTRTSTT